MKTQSETGFFPRLAPEGKAGYNNSVEEEREEPIKEFCRFMKLIWRYVRPYRRFILAVMLIKLLGTGTDLLMPYVLEHLLDHVIPASDSAWPVIAWGGVMLALTWITRVLNVKAN